MSGSVDKLRSSLDATNIYVNDHDFIHCRPVDVRSALDEIERLQAVVQSQLATSEHRGNQVAIRGIEIDRLQAELRLLADHPLIMQEGGTSDCDRAIRAMNKQEAEIERLKGLLESTQQEVADLQEMLDDVRDDNR